ncbi:MAG: sugar ABC transporter substrate-binding protein [Candidatus Dormibacteraeota bacterium]|nr:sugar ABC transporter substrate-binding protein [Candidatus Dormibacteraeota bacterium]
MASKLSRRTVLGRTLGIAGAVLAAACGAPTPSPGSGPTAPAAGATTAPPTSSSGAGAAATTPPPNPTTVTAATKPASAAGSPIELHYVTQLQPETQSWKDAAVVIDSFMQANPGITVVTEHVAFANLDTKLVTAARAGAPPDVSEVSDSFPQLAKGGYLLQLDQFVNDTKLDLKDYYEGKLQTCYIDNKLVALPITADCRGLWWNMKILNDAGFSQPPTYWDDLADVAQKVTKNGVSGWGIQGGNQGFMICEQFSAFFIQNDGKIISDDQTKAMTDQPEWITGATFWQDLTTKLKVTQPSASTDDHNAVFSLFAQGKIAMFPGGPWSRSDIERNNPNLTFGKDFSVSVLPYPKGKHPGTCQGGWLQSVWSGSKVQEATLKFLGHYHTTENIAQSAASAMPTRRSSTKLPPFNDPWYAPFWDTMPYARPPMPTMAATSEISTALYALLQSMLLGQQTADAAGKAFAQDVNERILPKYAPTALGTSCGCPEV